MAITQVFIMMVSKVAPGRLLLVVLGEVLAGGISMALGGYLLKKCYSSAPSNAPPVLGNSVP